MLECLNPRTLTHSIPHGADPQNLRDWKAYEQGLQARYDLEVYISLAAKRNWTPRPNGKPGPNHQYSEHALQLVLTIREAFRLPLRGAESFTRSLFKQYKLKLAVPDHTTLSRAKLSPRPWRTQAPPAVLVVDSTGVKTYGQGEWLREKHRVENRSEWVKLHVSVDYETGLMHRIEITPSSGLGSGDSSQLARVIAGSDAPAEVIADGAYDTKRVYETLHKLGTRATIPPQWNAACGLHPLRDANLKVIRRHGDKDVWKTRARYGRRSLVETWMHRYKQAFGDQVPEQSLQTQTRQLQIRAELLNFWTDPELQIRNRVCPFLGTS